MTATVPDAGGMRELVLHGPYLCKIDHLPVFRSWQIDRSP